MLFRLNKGIRLYILTAKHFALLRLTTTDITEKSYNILLKYTRSWITILYKNGKSVIETLNQNVQSSVKYN